MITASLPSLVKVSGMEEDQYSLAPLHFEEEEAEVQPWAVEEACSPLEEY